MAGQGSTPAMIVSGLIIVFGIIHFGVGIGVVARYRQYQDVFRPSIGISAFDIIIGVYAIGVGVVCLFGIIKQRPALSKYFL
jgi:threonine/homoserine/homoserine lactone efflux protein